MGRKTLSPTDRSREIRKFAEDFASCVYIGDVSSPESGAGRYAVSSEFREYHHATMTVPQELNYDATRLLQEIVDNTHDADIPVIMNNLEHAVSSLQSAYRLVSSNSCRLPETHKDTIKKSYDCSFNEFVETIQRISTLNY